MEYYIEEQKKQRNTAGGKAPADIYEICRKLGMKKFTMPMFPSNRGKVFQKLWMLFCVSLYWLKLERKVHSKDLVLYQHPMYANRTAVFFIDRIRRKKGGHFIALVHDLDSLRNNIDGVIERNVKTNQLADNVLLKKFDKVICHNESMKKYLIEQGFEPCRLVCLEIFDYLCESQCKPLSKGTIPSIAIAGNLAVGKCGYIYHIVENEKNQKLKVNLFGINYNEFYKNPNVIYHGSFKPEELGNHLIGDFGLVWDGPTAESCTGNTGNYLKYNNPHKTSMYLSAGMPVIVWKEAAIADYVLKNGVGIVVESLFEIESAIDKISDDDYKAMCSRVSEISKRLRTGFYFQQALEKCLR